MSYTTDKLLLAAKVLELSETRLRKAAEQDAIAAGVSEDQFPAWIDGWLRSNPRENFVDDVLEDLADIVDLIERRAK